jgi:hypothetical protein
VTASIFEAPVIVSAITGVATAIMAAMLIERLKISNTDRLDNMKSLQRWPNGQCVGELYSK